MEIPILQEWRSAHHGQESEQGEDLQHPKSKPQRNQEPLPRPSLQHRLPLLHGHVRESPNEGEPPLQAGTPTQKQGA